MEEKKKVPAVRFKEFTGDWERKKLGVVFKEYSEKNHPELPPLTIVQGGGTVLRDESDRSLQYDRSSLPNYKMVNKDDFIIHLRSFEGGMEKATITGIISPAYHTFHGQNIDSRFYYAYFRSRKFIDHDLFPYVYGIRDGRSIDVEGMKKIRIPYPSHKEQKQIGDFLDGIDFFLTLRQQKLNQLKKLKSYFLQNMFPAKGKKVPKIRFKGFTGDWEQRKLGDILVDLYNGQTPSRYRKDFWNGDVNWLTSGELNRGLVSNTIEKITNAGQDSAHLRVVPKGTFVMAITGLEAAGTRGNCAILGIDTTLNQSCMALFADEKKLDSKFLFQWYRMIGEDYGIRFTQGTKQQSYNVDIVKKLEIILPEIEEQQKIGKFLYKLDNLITLHQRKTEELQRLKEFMLQNLFV